MSSVYKRGDIIAVPFPFTDLSSSKLRPALIISNDSISNTGDVVIVMIDDVSCSPTIKEADDDETKTTRIRRTKMERNFIFCLIFLIELLFH